MFENIGDNIREIRKRKKMTQSALAHKLGKNIRTVQKYESGEITPPLEVILRMASILEIDLTSLLQGIDNNPNEILSYMNHNKVPPWTLLGIDIPQFVKNAKDPEIRETYVKIFGKEYLDDYIDLGLSVIYQQQWDEMEQNGTQEVTIEDIDEELKKILLAEFNKLTYEGKKKSIDLVKLVTQIQYYLKSGFRSTQ